MSPSSIPSSQLQQTLAEHSDLAHLVDRWSSLPDDVRAVILRLAELSRD